MKIKYKYNTGTSENWNSIIDYLSDIITLNGPTKPAKHGQYTLQSYSNSSRACTGQVLYSTTTEARTEVKAIEHKAPDGPTNGAESSQVLYDQL